MQPQALQPHCAGPCSTERVRRRDLPALMHALHRARIAVCMRRSTAHVSPRAAGVCWQQPAAAGHTASHCSPYFAEI